VLHRLLMIFIYNKLSFPLLFAFALCLCLFLMPRPLLSFSLSFCLSHPSTAMKFWPKFFWIWSFFDQNQQPLKNVEPLERILRALFISQCPYKFSSFLDLRNAFNMFRLFSREFRLFRFFFPGSACYSSLASPRNLPSWVKYHRKFESFGKEFRWTKFIAVERVTACLSIYLDSFLSCVSLSCSLSLSSEKYTR